MRIYTTRFGAVEITAEEILLFPRGLIGLEELRHWVLLADRLNDSVGWLQSMSRASTALPVVSPREFCPGYEVQVTRRDIQALELSADNQALVLAVISKSEEKLTLNLRAPLLLNLNRGCGRQVVTTAEQPVQFEIGHAPLLLRKTA